MSAALGARRKGLYRCDGWNTGIIIGLEIESFPATVILDAKDSQSFHPMAKGNSALPDLLYMA